MPNLQLSSKPDVSAESGDSSLSVYRHQIQNNPVLDQALKRNAAQLEKLAKSADVDPAVVIAVVRHRLRGKELRPAVADEAVVGEYKSSSIQLGHTKAMLKENGATAPTGEELIDRYARESAKEGSDETKRLQWTYSLKGSTQASAPAELHAYQETSPGSKMYRFVVVPEFFGAKTLREVFEQVRGKYIAHPERTLTGQCGVGGQYFCGEKVGKDLHDAPRADTWIRGEPVSDKTKPGTLIAWGWDKETRKYPNKRGVDNHTAIYMGRDRKGRALVMEQNVKSPDSPNLEYHMRTIEPGKEFFEVTSDQKFDAKKTESQISDTLILKGR